MMRSLPQKLLKSASLWSMLGTALRVGSGIITLPLALRSLSEAEMGLYYTFLGISGVASLMDFGFAQTVARNAAYAVGGAKRFVARGLPASNGDGEPNWLLLGHLKGAVQRWYQFVGGILMLLMVVLGGWFVDGQIHQSGLSTSLYWCWILFSVTASYGFITSYWQDLLMGIGGVKASAINGLIAQTIALVLLAGGLVGGLGLWAYAISAFVGSFIGRTLCKNAFLREAPIVKSHASSADRRALLLELWPMTWRQGVVLIGAFLIQRGNTLVCSAKLGLEETGKYGLSLNLINIVFQISAIPLMVAWPRIGQLRVQGDLPSIRKMFFSRIYGGLAVAVLGLGFLAILGDPLLVVIGSRTRLLPSTTFVLLGVVLWLENHHSLYGSLVLTENENPFVTPAIVSGVAIFLLSWMAAQRWGVEGLIAAQGVVQLAWNNWWTIIRGLRGLEPIPKPADLG